MQVQNHRKNSPIGGWTGGKTTLNRRFYDPALEYKIERATLSKEPQLRPAFSLFIQRNIPFIGKLVDKLR